MFKSRPLQKKKNALIIKYIYALTVHSQAREKTHLLSNGVETCSWNVVQVFRLVLTLVSISHLHYEIQFRYRISFKRFPPFMN